MANTLASALLGLASGYAQGRQTAWERGQAEQEKAKKEKQDAITQAIEFAKTGDADSAKNVLTKWPEYHPVMEKIAATARDVQKRTIDQFNLNNQNTIADNARMAQAAEQNQIHNYTGGWTEGDKSNFMAQEGDLSTLAGFLASYKKATSPQTVPGQWAQGPIPQQQTQSPSDMLGQLFGQPSNPTGPNPFATSLPNLAPPATAPGPSLTDILGAQYQLPPTTTPGWTPEGTKTEEQRMKDAANRANIYNRARLDAGKGNLRQANADAMRSQISRLDSYDPGPIDVAAAVTAQAAIDAKNAGVKQGQQKANAATANANTNAARAQATAAKRTSSGGGGGGTRTATPGASEPIKVSLAVQTKAMNMGYGTAAWKYLRPEVLASMGIVERKYMGTKKIVNPDGVTVTTIQGYIAPEGEAAIKALHDRGVAMARGGGKPTGSSAQARVDAAVKKNPALKTQGGGKPTGSSAQARVDAAVKKNPALKTQVGIARSRGESWEKIASYREFN